MFVDSKFVNNKFVTNKEDSMNRFRIIFASTVGAGLFFAHLAIAQNVPAPAISASAHGGYFATYGGGPATRRIEFSAVRDGLNNQTGQGSFFNITRGTKVHFTINCLRVEGNVATMSGIWDDHGQGDFPYMWLQVIDNGEGRNAQDKVSPLFTFNAPISCNDNPFPGATYGIDTSNGNIQVR
jgi:hypothetical protein